MAPTTIQLEVTSDHPVPVEPLLGGTVTVLNVSGDTLYYADHQQMSATDNQGSLTAGQSTTFSSTQWVRSASLSTVTVTINDLPSAGVGVGGLTDVATTATASGALVVNQHNPVDATAGPVTMTLPTGQKAGALISVEKEDSTTNTVTISGNIRGANTTNGLSAAFRATMYVAANSGSWWPVGDIKSLAYLLTLFSGVGEWGPGGTPGANTGASQTIPDPVVNSGFAIWRAVMNSATPAITLATPSKAGIRYVIRLDQDATGSRVPSFAAASGTITYPSGTLNFTGNAALAGAVNLVSAYWDGTNWFLLPDTSGTTFLQAANSLSEVAASGGDIGTARLNLKVPVLQRAKTVATSNVASLSGLSAINGFTPSANDPVLLVAQTTASQNGLWLTQSGAWTRPTDYTGVLTASRLAFVVGGAGAGNVYYLAATGSVTVDTTSTTWTLINASGSAGPQLAKELWKPTAALVENIDRRVPISWASTLAGLSSGRLSLTGGCQIPAGTSINTVTFTSGSVALGPYEVDSVIATGATSGTFTLSFTWKGNVYTTAAIAWNAASSAVQSALLAATRTGPIAFSADTSASSIVCTNGPLPGTAVTITFGNLANGPVSAQSANNASLVGGTAAFTQTTAGVAASNQWACLVDQSLNVLVKSADLTNAAWPTNTAQSFTLAGTYTPVVDTPVWAGIVIVHTGTLVQFAGAGLSSSLITALSPVLTGTSTTGLTNPASLGATAAALTASTNHYYVQLA